LDAVERAEAEAILDGDRETAISLLLRVGELVEANRRLEARVAELEQRLNRSSRNSSLPPSRDPPSALPRPRQPGSGRGPGGQAGQEGRNRRLLPLELVDELVEHWPARCARCCRCFGEAERIDVAFPQRHQVAELPPIAVWVSEHRLHRLRCPSAVGRRAPSFRPRCPAAPSARACRRPSRRSRSETVSPVATRSS
jgi:transposase